MLSIAVRATRHAVASAATRTGTTTKNPTSGTGRLFLACPLQRSRRMLPAPRDRLRRRTRRGGGQSGLPGRRGADGKIFEDHLDEPQSHDRALALVALCVGGMVLARNVGDADFTDGFRRAAHAEVLRVAGWR